MTTASAPGKIILFGEHAVVYGQPAIAVPVSQVRATAVVEPIPADDILLHAPDLGYQLWYSAAPEGDPLAAAVRVIYAQLELPPTGLAITVSSNIPIASGLGSGAAIAAALIQAVAEHHGRVDLATPTAVSALTYEVERLHHGTPSGIDNTVVSHEQAVYFVRDLVTYAPDIWQRLWQSHPRLPLPTLETFRVRHPLRILIANTGIPAPTKESVGDVRRQWLADPATFEPLFKACGQIAQRARLAIEAGDLPLVGQLMLANHMLLRRLTVSSPELDTLVNTAVSAGALGAKLSGGGRGGNMIALVQNEDDAAAVLSALRRAGATAVLETVVR
jgi:mevalonate kinase